MWQNRLYVHCLIFLSRKNQIDAQYVNMSLYLKFKT